MNPATRHLKTILCHKRRPISPEASLARSRLAFALFALLFCLATIAAPVHADETVVLPVIKATGFDSDSDGFVYGDDLFRNTNQPAYAAGAYLPSGGQSGGGLQVLLGNVDDVDIFGMSGGWRYLFDLDQPGDLTITFSYKLDMTADYDSLARGQVLLAVDGALTSSGDESYVDQLQGNGPGGDSQTTGWESTTVTVDAVPAGSHTVMIGGYSNRKLTAGDISELLIDDVTISYTANSSNQVINRGIDVSGYHGAVASGGSTATNVGINILANGGNAADGTAATLLALTEADSSLVAFGGEVPIIVYDKNTAEIKVISGQGPAPAAATLAYFQSIGGIPGGTNIKNSAVPGLLLGTLTLLKEYGTLTFEEVATPAQQLFAAHTGWKSDMAGTLQALINADKNARASGKTREEGIEAARDLFYSGTIATDMDTWLDNNGGLVQLGDLQSFGSQWARLEDPVAVDYRGFTVYKAGPWTQGPYMLNTLQILEGYNPLAMGHNQPDYIHTSIEALKLGFADRDEYFGDPLFVDVPLTPMMSDQYTALRRGLIDPNSASLTVRPGDPENMQPLLTSNPVYGPYGEESATFDTSTVVTADRWGNVIVATPSGWGGRLLGSTGVYYGNRLRSLNAWTDHPNNVAPGKRPRITLTPTLVFKDGKPVLGISVAGGDQQDQAALQLVMNHIDFGLEAGESANAKRFGTQHYTGSFSQPAPQLGSLTLDSGTPTSIKNDLANRGHVVRTDSASYGRPSVLVLQKETGPIQAAGDGSAGRYAAAFTDLCTAAYSGFIFSDLNRNGSYDPPSEATIKGLNVPVYLVPISPVGLTEMRVTRADDGAFSFTGLAPGEYLVQVEDTYLRETLLQFPTSERIRSITIGRCSGTNTGFGFALPATDAGIIGGQVWFDENENDQVDEWYDSNNDNTVTQNIPDSDGRVDFSLYEYVNINLDDDSNGSYEPGEIRDCGLSFTELVLTDEGNQETEHLTGVLGHYMAYPLAFGTYQVAIKDNDQLAADAAVMNESGLCLPLQPANLPISWDFRSLFGAQKALAQASGDACEPAGGSQIPGISISQGTPRSLANDFATICFDPTAVTTSSLGSSGSSVSGLPISLFLFGLLLTAFVFVRRRRH